MSQVVFNNNNSRRLDRTQSLPLRLSILFVLLVLGLFGCSQFKTGAGPRSEFLSDVPQMDEEQTKRAPFHRSWGKREDSAKKHFDSVYFRPVETSILLKIPTTDRSATDEEIAEVALYMHTNFVAALEKLEDDELRVVLEPSPSSLIVSLALTELEPTSVLLNVAGSVSGNFVPGSGMVMNSLAKGRVAMELKVFNYGGELLGAAGDRESDISSLMNVNDYTRLGHAKIRIDEWAAQFAELLVTPPEHVVSDSIGFTLKPW